MKKLLSAIIIIALILAAAGAAYYFIIENPSTLNGVRLARYSIVYSEDEYDYNKRAAEYIRDSIKARTSLDLDIIKDDEEKRKYEIVVGETNREISSQLDKNTLGTEFAILANDDSIALEANYFVIAAAAYFFVETYLPSDAFDTTVPKETLVHEPIV